MVSADSFGNALGNSIVGAIETTPAEASIGGGTINTDGSPPQYDFSGSGGFNFATGQAPAGTIGGSLASSYDTRDQVAATEQQFEADADSAVAASFGPVDLSGVADQAANLKINIAPDVRALNAAQAPIPEVSGFSKDLTLAQGALFIPHDANGNIILPSGGQIAAGMQAAAQAKQEAQYRLTGGAEVGPTISQFSYDPVGAILGATIGNLIAPLTSIGRSDDRTVNFFTGTELNGEEIQDSKIGLLTLGAGELTAALGGVSAFTRGLSSIRDADSLFSRASIAGNSGNTFGTGVRGVSFFDKTIFDSYYSPTPVTLGNPNGAPVFFTLSDDASLVRNAADAARYTGMAPSVERAYLGGGDVYGVSFSAEGYPIVKPTALDAGPNPNFLQTFGTTAVRTSGPNSGFLVNPTREFVLPGGFQPSDIQVFKLGPNGERIPQ